MAAARSNSSGSEKNECAAVGEERALRMRPTPCGCYAATEGRLGNRAWQSRQEQGNDRFSTAPPPSRFFRTFLVEPRKVPAGGCTSKRKESGNVKSIPVSKCTLKVATTTAWSRNDTVGSASKQLDKSEFGIYRVILSEGEESLLAQ